MIRNKFRVKDIDKINLELKILINCLKITVMIYLVFSYSWSSILQCLSFIRNLSVFITKIYLVYEQ